AERIGKRDQVLDPAFVGERAGAAGDRDAGLLQARREGVKRGCVGDLPTEEGDALTAVRGDQEPLLAVIHAEGEAVAAPIDDLHAEECRAKVRPVLERL